MSIFPCIIASREDPCRTSILFDRRVCDTNIPAFEKLADEIENTSGGRFTLDLVLRKHGFIVIIDNEAIRFADTGVNFPVGMTFELHDNDEAAPIIERLVRLIKSTCAQSRDYDPSLYPKQTPQTESER